MPVGAYGASAEIMGHVAPDGPVYQAGTLSANPVAMSAGYAAIQQLLQPGFYEDQERRTQLFVDTVLSHCLEQDYAFNIQHIGSIFWITFSNERIKTADQIDADGMEKFKLLHHELLQKGVYLGPSGYEVGFVSAAHTEADLIEAATILCECLDTIMK